MDNVTIHDSFSPALSEVDIARFEELIDSRLPADYRRFLLAHNGGRPEPSVFSVYGQTNKYDEPFNQSSVVNWFFGLHDGEHYRLTELLHWMGDRVPANLLPIGEDPFGNMICLSLSGPDRGTVYFWDHEDESEEGEPPTYRNIYFIAKSFDKFLNMLHDLPED
jgi:cell wall assembly regulator SMI1